MYGSMAFTIGAGVMFGRRVIGLGHRVLMRGGWRAGLTIIAATIPTGEVIGVSGRRGFGVVYTRPSSN